LVIGGDKLADGFDGESDGEQIPNLARVTSGAETYVKRGRGGDRENRGVESIGEQQAGEGGANEFEIVSKGESRKESGEQSEPRKLARGEQEALTGYARRNVPGSERRQGECTPTGRRNRNWGAIVCAGS